MTMFTRCSSCGAVFRVTLEHLQASAGQVRCGVCETVFDAFASLTASDPRGEGMPAPQTMSARPPAGRENRSAATAREVDSPAGLGRQSAAAAPVQADHGGTSGAAVGNAKPPSPPPPPSPAATAARDLPAPAVSRGRDWAPALVVLLSLAGFLQAGYFLRAELAAYAPALRPWLERACLPLGCGVPLPRATEQLSIEGSDLRALDPTRPGRVLLTATIRNRAPFTQAWPLLELTLTNVRDEAVIRRAFTATEYLAPAAPGPGIGPGVEATVRMPLEAQDLQPVGYRLYLFHP